MVFLLTTERADHEEQLVSLKQQLLQHVESNKYLKTKSEKLKVDKNALEESYLEELVWLINTNKVVTELLQSYGQPVETIPMLSKRPTFSTKDLHKSALGHHNPLYLKSAQLCRPALYLGDVDSESVSKDICSVVLTSDIAVEPRSNCVKEHSRNLELEAEILKLKEELTAVRIKNDSLRDENMSIKKRYQDLYQSKAESNSNVSSRAAVPEKKVLAPGLYAMTPKYAPPQKRNNREANTPLPKEREVASAKLHHMIAPGSSSGPTGNIFTSSTTKVDSESINGSDEDITNQYEYKQTLDVSAGTPNLSTGTSFNPKREGQQIGMQKIDDMFRNLGCQEYHI
ncbi:hypothetical protein Tco_0898481 [Tanacetum coccineum]